MFPLTGIKVLDISNYLAGPLCGMFLADFGADVIKFERPDGGDEMRYWGNNKDGVGLYYKVVNRGKKSITVDLRTPLGVEILKRLVADADIVIENYRTGTLERWGIGYDVLSAINPRVNLIRITGFGQTGPYSKRPGFGTLAEAFAGYAYISGYPDRPPMLPGFGLANSTTGLMGAFLAMVALKETQKSGKGQIVDLAIYETLFSLLGPQVVDFDQLGLVQERNGSRLPFTAPRNTFQTKDGKWIAIAGSAQSIFERICASIARLDLLNDDRFASNRARLTNAEALEEELQKSIAEFDYDDLWSRFMHNDAAIAPVNSVAQAMDDVHVAARKNVAVVPDDELGGPLKMQNIVGLLSRTPAEIAWSGPRLGEHNQEILVEQLGYTENELLASGFVAADRPATTGAQKGS